MSLNRMLMASLKAKSGTTFLDPFLTNTKAAFSTSKLFTTSTLSLQIRRSSDNATLDIGFVSNIFDTASTTAFIGVGTGFVSKWYDQTGNGNDYVQSTNANQPQITLSSQNGLPALTFDGVASFMQSSSFLDSSFNTNTTFFTLASKRSTSFVLHESSSDGSYYAARNLNSSLYQTSAGNINAPSYLQNPELVQLEVFNYNGVEIDMFMNNAPYNSIATTTSMGLSGFMYLGNHDGAGFWWDGDIYTKIYMNAALSKSDLQTVGRKIGSDFGLLQIPQLTFDGNSLTSGVNSTTGGPAYPGTSYPAQLMALVGGYGVNYNYLNQALGGDRTEDLISEYSGSNIYNTNGFCSKLIDIFWEGRNSIYQGDSAATAYAGLNTYLAIYKALGYKIAVITCEPTWAIGGVGAGANTYGVTNASYETQRLAYNAMVIAGVGTNYDYVIDLSADSRIGDPANLGDTTYWDAAGTHMTDAGYGIVAGLCESTLNTILNS